LVEGGGVDLGVDGWLGMKLIEYCYGWDFGKRLYKGARMRCEYGYGNGCSVILI
jgi:hypothetical protein